VFWRGGARGHPAHGALRRRRVHLTSPHLGCSVAIV
jgi:hypothetical protein